VIRELVEGRSYEEIAARRGTSQRTIANQIVAVFRRKAVSGRNDLVHRLFEESPLQTPTVPPPIMPVAAWAS
jgi:DNA-binding NarL/FixJ family response regulator